jgi:MFS family permease
MNVSVSKTESAAPAPAFVRDQFTWLAYGMMAIFAYLQAASGPVMPFLRDELGLSYTVGGLHPSAFALGAVLSSLLGSRILRAWGRARVLWASISSMVLAAVLFTLGPHALVTIACMLVMGVGGLLTLLTVTASLSDHYTTYRGVALAEANVTASLGASLVPLLVGALQQSIIGWRGALYVPVLVLALLLLLFGRAQVPQPPRSDEATSSAPARLPVLFWVYWGILYLGVSIEWCMIIWSADFFVAEIGLPKSQAASMVSVFLLAMLGGRFVGSRLARRFSAAALLLAAVFLLLLGFPLFWLAPAVPLNVAGLFLAGLGVANLFPMAITLALTTAPEQADLASARALLAGAIAVLTAPLLLGQLADQFGIHVAFGIVSLLILCILGMVLFARVRVARAAGLSSSL